GDLLDCFDLELIRVPLAAHTNLLGCHKLWLEDVYERLAGPIRSCHQFASMDLLVMQKVHQLEQSEMSLVEQTRWPDHCYDEGKLKYPACIPEGLA
ncbi:hypothetical protein, partial [Burkholderia sp.]|uniref:hypothetical protein n=1 Tax=Burkholderia sp. TaxID=36773 RepID=UPI00258BB217